MKSRGASKRGSELNERGKVLIQVNDGEESKMAMSQGRQVEVEGERETSEYVIQNLIVFRCRGKRCAEDVTGL